MKRKEKNNVEVAKQDVVVSQVVNEVNETRYACNMFEENVLHEKVVTINNALLQKVDVLVSSRIAYFRKAIKLDMSYEKLVRLDVVFYSKTNDRSKSRREDKKENLYDYCYKNRTSKQLRDVLIEKDIVSYLNKKFEKNNVFFTVSEYKSLVK